MRAYLTRSPAISPWTRTAGLFLAAAACEFGVERATGERAGQGGDESLVAQGNNGEPGPAPAARCVSKRHAPPIAFPRRWPGLLSAGRGAHTARPVRGNSGPSGGCAPTACGGVRASVRTQSPCGDAAATPFPLRGNAGTQWQCGSRRRCAELGRQRCRAASTEYPRCLGDADAVCQRHAAQRRRPCGFAHRPLHLCGGATPQAVVQAC
jgi:hypothetical protein